MSKTFVLVAALALVAATAAVAAPPKPQFEDFPRNQQKRLLERVASAPAPYRRALRATYSRVTLRVSGEIQNGSYITTKERGGEKQFVVYLDLMTRKPGRYGNHLTLHELGHVIANEWFDQADYDRFWELFRQSPSWRDCFETGSPDIPCVPDSEVLADQLAFYGTGVLGFRSSYDVPPLADPPAMTAAIEAGVGNGPAG
jgi:hypothetical protein